MECPARATELTTIHDFTRLAREVAATGRPHILRDNGEDLVVVSPARARPPKTKPLTQAQRQAIEALAGAWEGRINPDDFKRELREAQWDDRPAIDL